MEGSMSVSPAPVREQPLLPGGAPGRAPRPAWRSRITRLDVKITPYFLIAPFFILFGVFGIYPLIYNIWASVHWNKIDEPDKQGWSGFANYSKLLGDDEMWKALENTFGLFVLSAVPQLIIALLLAAVLNRKLRFQTFFRMGVLLPYVTPIVASTLVFGAVFATQGGILNSVLHKEI